jgi:hypothetical protein
MEADAVNSPQIERAPVTRLHSCFGIILIAIFAGPFVCCAGILLWDNVWGSVVEWVTHYPNSELVRVDYGVYGSNDMQTKIYLRWTADTVEQVAAHYDHFPIYRGHVRIIDTRDKTSKLTACAWNIGFNYQYDNDPQNRPCNLARRLIDERGGTVIEFAHDYWAG